MYWVLNSPTSIEKLAFYSSFRSVAAMLVDENSTDWQYLLSNAFPI
jgi:hypothetical protein